MNIRAVILMLGLTTSPLGIVYAAENKEKIPLDSVILADPQLDSCLDNMALENNWETTFDVTELYCSGVDTLAGMEVFHRLMQANISMGYTRDLSPFQFTKKITKLTLEDQFIRDLTSLGDLKQLEYLNLGGNPLKDITPLGSAQSLKTLFLFEANIVDISALAELKQLTSLDLNFNRIETVGELSQLIKLEGLNLSNAFAKDADIDALITPIGELKNLKRITLAGNMIYDATVLADLKKLEFIDLSVNQIQNLLFLKNKKKLNVLYLNNNSLDQWDYLTQLPALEVLNLRSNSISTIPDPVIDDMVNNMQLLKEIDISNNPIKNCEDIEKLAAALPNTKIVGPAHCGF